MMLASAWLFFLFGLGIGVPLGVALLATRWCGLEGPWSSLKPVPPRSNGRPANPERVAEIRKARLEQEVREAQHSARLRSDPLPPLARPTGNPEPPPNHSPLPKAPDPPFFPPTLPPKADRDKTEQEGALEALRLTAAPAKFSQRRKERPV